MTAVYANNENGAFGFNTDGYVYPQFLGTPLRAPTTQDIYTPGTRWQDNSVNPPVQYYTVGGGLWYQTANTAFGVSSVSGTSNQVVVSPTTGNAVASLPSTLIAPGSVTATTTLTATSGNITATNGNLVLSAAGNKLQIHATTSASDSVGVSGAMAGTPGTVTVTSTAVTASSVILYSRNGAAGTLGEVSISAQSSGSFTLLSTDNETSTFNYLIIN